MLMESQKIETEWLAYDLCSLLHAEIRPDCPTEHQQLISPPRSYHAAACAWFELLLLLSSSILP